MSLNHITIYPTGRCNLSCAYCFENTHQWCRADSTIETMRTSVDFLIRESGNQENLNIGFFGGEPLLRPDLVDETCTYAKEQGVKFGKRFGFSVTTNMTLIDDNVLQVLKKHNIMLLASLDGMPRKDNVRFWQNTQETSAWHAFSNLLFAQKNGVGIQLRWTISPHNLKYVAEDCKTMMAIGIRNFALEFVYECEWTKDDLDLLEFELRELAKLYISELRNGRELHVKPINDGFSVYTAEQRQTLRCGLGYFGVGISAEGTIQPCHRFVSREDAKDWALGSVHTEFDKAKRDKMVADWKLDKVKITDGRKCEDCPIKLRCPGGICFLVNLDITKDFYTVPHVYCDIQLACQKVSNDVLGVLYGEKNSTMLKILGQGQHTCAGHGKG